MTVVRHLCCPRCDLETEREDVHGVAVERCPRCSGLFLDRGDLDRVAEGGSLEYSTVHGDSFRHADRHPRIRCPRCAAATMQRVEFNVHTDIILDYCEACGGFWLDGPELERIEGEVRRLDEAARDVPDPPMLWFARFLWSLPFR